MAKRKFADKLINTKDINEEMRLIDGSDIDYITPSGVVLCDYGEGMFFQKKPFINRHNGYVYINVHLKSGKVVQRRLHRELAKAYIPNPHNLEYVMHIDNNKSNYNLSNLKWGTASDNTKQAYNDGLAVNACGEDDSQSFPVDMYDLFTAEIVQHYGSARQAADDLGIEPAAVLYSCKKKTARVRKPYYFRFTSDGNIEIPEYVGMYDFDTDEQISRYVNIGHAARETGISERTIGQQVSSGQKPKRCFKGRKRVYFLTIRHD